MSCVTAYTPREKRNPLRSLGEKEIFRVGFRRFLFQGYVIKMAPEPRSGVRICYFVLSGGLNSACGFMRGGSRARRSGLFNRVGVVFCVWRRISFRVAQERIWIDRQKEGGRRRRNTIQKFIRGRMQGRKTKAQRGGKESSMASLVCLRPLVEVVC